MSSICVISLATRPPPICNVISRQVMAIIRWASNHRDIVTTVGLLRSTSDLYLLAHSLVTSCQLVTKLECLEMRAYVGSTGWQASSCQNPISFDTIVTCDLGFKYKKIPLYYQCGINHFHGLPIEIALESLWSLFVTIWSRDRENFDILTLACWAQPLWEPILTHMLHCFSCICTWRKQVRQNNAFLVSCSWFGPFQYEWMQGFIRAPNLAFAKFW